MRNIPLQFMLFSVLALAMTLSPKARAAAPAMAGPPASYVPLPIRAEVLPVLSCEQLVQQDFSRVSEGPARIQSAAIEPAQPGRSEFCLVKGYVAPTIQFELRLPTHGYTGRYLQGGCGGNCGRIYAGMMPACDNGVAFGGAFAVGFEDSGHVGGDGVWALGGEQVRVDFAYRAAHAFSQAAKAIITSYYGQAPAFAYFQGCSDGGREAMAETQRYPHDFNGVIAGSPAHRITEAMERFIWEARYGTDAQGQPVFTSAALARLHAAVLEACDALDGLKDGQIDDPRRCHFDPALLQCQQAAATDCLTGEQVSAARKFYEGPHDAAGLALYPGGEPYGSELTWAGRGALSQAGAPMLAEMVRLMTYQGQLPDDITVRTWPFDRASFDELRRRGAIFDAADPDLRPFQAAGGHLILWNGAADPAAGVYGVPDYYQHLEDAVGGLAAARSFARLFVVPGVYHCAGGYVPYDEDFLGAMLQWVEQGVAPEAVIASARLADGTLRRRPVYAYPEQARYRGHGDINDAASFRPIAPSKPPADAFDWAGAQPLETAHAPQAQ